MQTITRLTLFALLICLPLSGQTEDTLKDLSSDPTETQDYDSSNTEGFPSSIVGHVNVINGNYCDNEVDMVIPAPEPLVVQRDFGGRYSDYLSEWHFGHHNLHKIETKKVPVDSRHRGLALDQIASISEEDAEETEDIEIDEADFNRRCSGDYCKVYDYEVFEYGGIQVPLKSVKPITKFFAKYWTNCSSVISGKTNLKNLARIKNDSETVFKDGSGTTFTFNYGHLIHIFKRNGNWIKFENLKDPKNKKINYITKLESLNRHNLSRASYVIYGEKELEQKVKEKNSDLQIVIVGSHKQAVQYFFEGKDKKSLYLKQVIRPQAPNITYEKITQGFRKSFPEGRYLEVIGDEKQVTQIKAPLGSGIEPVPMYRYVYGSYVTSVYDAYGSITNYHYSKDKRLSSIVRHIPNQVYPIEKFHWEVDKKSPLVGNLLTRSIIDSTGKAHLARRYFYDPYGNITKEVLYGNLTGKNPIPLLCDEEGCPLDNGCETYVKEYAYSNDGLNNKIKESDGRCIIDYAYYPNSEQLYSKFVYTYRGLEKRHFYGYDDDGLLALEVIDDGKTPYFMDFTGATQCKIKKIRNRSVAPFGLPEEVAEYYVDFATGQQVLLKKSISSYSVEGKLLRTNHYDSNQTFVYFTDYTYDEKGNLIQEINPLGQAIQRRYDANHNLIYEQGPSHEFYKTFTYDFCNRLIREDTILAGGEGFSVSHRYDLLGRKIGTTDIYGNEVQYQYDLLGRMIQTSHPAMRLTNNVIIKPIERYEYNVLGHPTLIQDASGNITRKEYTIRGKPSRIIFPDGSQELFEYTLDGLLAKTVAKNKSSTHFTYDYQGRLIHKAHYDEKGILISQASSVYSAFNLLKEVDESGLETHYQYDFAGRIKKIQKGDSITDYEYDSLGRTSAEIQWINAKEKAVKRYFYDVADRTIEERIEDETGKVLECVRYGYDEKGNRSLIWKFINGQTVCSETKYDCFKQPLSIRDPEGNITHFIPNYAFYNEIQQRVPCLITIDPLGRKTIEIKNALGKVVAVKKFNLQNQEIQKTEQTYDLTGNLTSVVHTVFNGPQALKQIVTLFMYDSMNRQTDLYEAWGLPEQKHTKTVYNLSGFKEAVIKPSGVILFHKYDAQGRLIDFTSSDLSFNYHYTYDANGNVAQVDDRCKNWATKKSYDRNQHLIKEILGNHLEMIYGFDLIGRVIFAQFANGKQIHYKYDAAHLLEVAHENFHHYYRQYDTSGHLLNAKLMNSLEVSFGYTLNGRTRLIDSAPWKEEILDFNALGLIKKVKYSSQGTTEENVYQYDDLDQLCLEQGSSSYRYKYDSLENRIEKNGQAYKVNDLNQILNDSAVNYRYDLNGNLIQQGDYRYAYDALDRLIKVETSSHKFEYLYDETNRRLRKICFEHVEGLWREKDVIDYMYQGQNEVGCYSKSQGQWQWRILGKGKGSEIGATVYMELEGQGFIPLHDHVGNIRCLMDTQGDLVENYHFSAFGEEEQTGWRNPWRFASKRHDPETGFIYFGLRYYFPKLGSWVTADPGGFIDGPNLYAYVHNSPLNCFDLYGLSTRFVFSFGSNGFSFSISGGGGGKGLAKLIANAAWRGASAIINSIGDTLFLAATHLVPVGPWRSALRKATSQISSDPGRNLTEDPSCHGWVQSSNSNLTAIIVNGMLTSHIETFTRSIFAGALLEAGSICGAYNSTDGFINDLGEVILQKLGFRTSSMDAFIRSVMQAHYTNPNATILVIGHSQAGQIIASSAKYLPPEVRAKMHVYTFGSANLIPDKIFAKTTNFVSKSDPIPMLASPIKYLKAAFGYGNSSVTFLDSKEWFGLDHSFDNETYQGALKFLANIYRPRK